ncbi:hypothetical protein BOX37_13315 [Nocardia mangyaensis]|uniref:DUF2867 domain-containing protein n=1 Tax=Nocardia mangyaensis TaxID=2213200 RepID=A0A1J0W209_9NOCA|nr:hypothetical protein BOX37_13315 [Nocardia mangyaensis]
MRRALDNAHAVRRYWGTTEQERPEFEECMNHVAPPWDTYYRGITVRATSAVTWRWLCQMRVAPYSYDWIDNFGRRSPRQWTPGADELAAGQKILMIFQVSSFERDQHITMRIHPWLRWFWGDTCCTFRVVERPEGGDCRLLMIMTVHDRTGAFARYTGLYALRKYLFPWGELVMVHKQFRTFKQLAEATPVTPPAESTERGA